MTDIAPIEDHTEQALGLLISQYRDLPRMGGLVSSFTNRLQELDDCNWDVINKRLLDYTDRDGNPAHAVGAQLDTIGRIVGQARGGQDDATYLIYIRAKIFLNKSRGRRGEVVKLLKLIETALFTYTEFYPAAVWIDFIAPPTVDPNVLSQLAKRVVSGGVRLDVIVGFQTDAFLLGDDNAATTVDTVHGLSDDGETTGGYLSGVY